MILLAILLPPVALLAMKRYWEFAIVLILWLLAFPAMLFFLLPGIALWTLSSTVAMFYVSERSTARHFDRISDAITRASVRVAPEPQSMNAKPLPWGSGGYSEQTERAADEILGRERAKVREAYRAEDEWLSGSQKEEMRRVWNRWGFPVIAALIVIPVGYVLGPPFVETSKQKWDRFMGNDIASLVACCEAMCRHMECNGSIKISCEQAHIEAELARTKLTIRDAKKNVVTALGKGPSGVQIPECM